MEGYCILFLFLPSFAHPLKYLHTHGQLKYAPLQWEASKHTSWYSCSLKFDFKIQLIIN